MTVQMGFVQIIEFQTSRLDEVEALGRDISEKLDDGRPSSPSRTTIAADRDRPGYYLNIVEFASYEAAMENSSRPEIGEFAARWRSSAIPLPGSTTWMFERCGSRRTPPE